MKPRSNFARSSFVFKEEIGKGKSKVSKVGILNRKEEGRKEGKKKREKRDGNEGRGRRKLEGKEARESREIMTGNVNGKARKGRTYNKRDRQCLVVFFWCSYALCSSSIVL